ncbi:TonB-dependent receptor [Fulvivirga sedimenti]|uniref:TonB-dependent receptor n=1 Tax=Fulvivirga sedimenti TaxID=2879465 RepID=A0A9X1KZG0_9BACT|nr:TonB-dependent receptor [Fulvivirga sedimenti]MCA6078215.1 TonB-dependent receptor [Fulvivirga sedimenti]
MHRLLVFLFFLALCGEVYPQNSEDPVLRFTKDYTETSLTTVLQEESSANSIKVFYKQDWGIEAFKVNAAAGEPLLEKIRQVLEPNGYGILFYANNLIVLNQPGLESYKYEQWADDDPLLDQFMLIGEGKPEDATKPVSVSGYIRDGGDNSPLVGASIQAEGTDQGTVTNYNGYYELQLLPGRYEMQVQYAGYERQNIPVQVLNTGSLDIELFNQTVRLEEVTISALGQEEGVSEKVAGKEVIGIEAIKSLPAFMGEVDPVRSLISLPGISSVGEGTAGYNVRGGDPGQNLLLQDHAIIYNSAHMFGFFSAFNPDLIRDVVLYKGGGPANYGGRVSSVLNVNLRNGNAKNFEANGGIGLVSSRLTIEGPIKKERTSFIVGGRASYSDWLLKQMKDPNLYQSAASFYDLNLKVNHVHDQKNVFNLSTYMSQDRFEFASDTTYYWKSKAATLGWSHIFSPNLLMQTHAVFSNYQSDIQNRESAFAFDYNSGITNYQGKVDFSWTVNSSHKLDFGISSLYYGFDLGSFEPLLNNENEEPVEISGEQGLESAFYINDEFSITPRLSLVYGVRFSNYLTLGGKYYQYADDQPKSVASIQDTLVYSKNQIAKSFSGFEPRLSLRWLINSNTSLKTSYYRTRQYVHLISNTTAISPVDFWKSSGYNLEPSIADQYTFGIFRNWRDNMYEVSAEAYYKKTDQIVDYKDGATILLNETLDADLVQGEGQAYGVEFLFRKNRGKLTGWLGYTYSRSKRKFLNEMFDEETINGGELYPSNYDKPHDVSLVLNYKTSRRFSISLNFAYSTGRPITVPVSKFQYEDILSVLNYSERNQFRVPDYHRLDLSFTLKSKLKKDKLINGEWVLSLYNVYGRKNPYSVYFSQRGNAFQLSILGSIFPSLSYNFRI